MAGAVCPWCLCSPGISEQTLLLVLGLSPCPWGAVGQRGLQLALPSSFGTEMLLSHPQNMFTVHCAGGICLISLHQDPNKRPSQVGRCGRMEGCPEGMRLLPRTGPCAMGGTACDTPHPKGAGVQPMTHCSVKVTQLCVRELWSRRWRG